MKHINTNQAPQAIGPYSQGVMVNNMLFLSGQIALNPENRELISGDAGDETHQIMKNLSAVLHEAGASFDNVVKTTIFLKNMDDFPLVNEVYGSYLKEGKYPARETVQVAKLPKDVQVEISMIAVL
ncbi:MAG: RidA family protein [Flavobacteriaceae bacterium]|nr:RidA family protein [Flavobacteriaceae bacterium]